MQDKINILTAKLLDSIQSSAASGKVANPLEVEALAVLLKCSVLVEHSNMLCQVIRDDREEATAVARSYRNNPFDYIPDDRNQIRTKAIRAHEALLENKQG